MIYPYRCSICNKEKEVERSIYDDAVAPICDSCNLAMDRVWSAHQLNLILQDFIVRIIRRHMKLKDLTVTTDFNNFNLSIKVQSQDLTELFAIANTVFNECDEPVEPDLSKITTEGHKWGVMPATTYYGSNPTIVNQTVTGTSSSTLLRDAYEGSAYCVKCKESRNFKGDIKVSDSGRRMAMGVCGVCGTKLNRILGKTNN